MVNGTDHAAAIFTTPTRDLEITDKRLTLGTPEVQIANLRLAKDLNQVCVYPHPHILAERVDASRYAGEPYKLMLANGTPQLQHVAFDLSILEFYRNDPRYFYSCDDMHGFVAIHDEFSEAENTPARDKVVLETFGFAYNPNFDRAVASFVCYLARLTPEHQAIWRAKQLPDEFRLHPDFFRTQIIGDWPTQLPILTALLMELRIINAMAGAMNRPPFFQNAPDPATRPKRLGLLVRPTLGEFNEFVHTLDKLLADNINKSFFQGDVPDTDETERADGKVVVTQRGTLRILDEWIRARFQTDDWKPYEEAIAAFRTIRKRRQKPAHAIEADRFDQKYFHEQRGLVLRAYTAVRTLRQMLANHPATATIPVPRLLYEGKICSY